MKNIIMASTSTVYGSNSLEYLFNELTPFFEGVSSILFVPYARPGGISHDNYTAHISERFAQIGKRVKGIHEFTNTKSAIEEAEAIYIGGGNTFLLIDQIYKLDLLDAIKTVVEAGTKYLGTSAGSNICGLTMNTTNDMPIVYPPSFKTFGFVPFNINPHYLDPNLSSTHKGETRETRIKEFHKFNSQPVVGLREGSWLKVEGNTIILKGELQARIFEYGKQPYEINPGSNIASLS